MQLLKSESCSSFLSFSLNLLFLLISTICALGALLTYKVKDLGQFLFIEFETHHQAFIGEILAEHKFVTINI